MPDDASQETPPDGGFADVLAEILQAEEQGRAPDVERYVSSFPDLEPRLRAYFRDRERFERLAAHLAPTPPRGAGAGTDGPAALMPGMRFGGYEILAELGRGGMGVVYRARQLTPEREVALKMIRTDRLEGLSEAERRQWIDRFRREAQLVAGLDQHPHIVTLYEVGDHEGRPYFTMQLVAGGNLAQRLRSAKEADSAAADRRVREQRDNARLLSQAARAVDYAHRQRGAEAAPRPQARQHPARRGGPAAGRRLRPGAAAGRDGEPGGVRHRGHGRLLRRPERGQVAAKGAMTTAADVYGLGAILYEAMTGRPPFRGDTDLETLLSVLEDEPARPRALDRRLSRDLETVCLKCLEKEPARRYRSAAALADDLDNWLAGRPINARPVGAPGRLWRWCRRNPLVAGAGAVTVLTFVVAFILVALSLYRTAAMAREKGDLADRNAGLAAANGTLAEANKKEADRANRAADEARTQSRTARRELARLAVQEGLNLCENQGDAARGLPCLAYGLERAEDADAPELAQAVRANLAAWRGNLLAQRAVLVHENSREIHQAAISPDGRVVGTACGDGAIRLWDAATGKPLGEPLGAVHPPTVVRAPPGVADDPLHASMDLLSPDEDPAYAVAFSPDGQWVAGGSLRGRIHVGSTRRPAGQGNATSRRQPRPGVRDQQGRRLRQQRNRRAGFPPRRPGVDGGGPGRADPPLGPGHGGEARRPAAAGDHQRRRLQPGRAVAAGGLPGGKPARGRVRVRLRDLQTPV